MEPVTRQNAVWCLIGKIEGDLAWIRENDPCGILRVPRCRYGLVRSCVAALDDDPKHWAIHVGLAARIRLLIHGRVLSLLLKPIPGHPLQLGVELRRAIGECHSVCFEKRRTLGQGPGDTIVNRFDTDDTEFDHRVKLNHFGRIASKSPTAAAEHPNKEFKRGLQACGS